MLGVNEVVDLGAFLDPLAVRLAAGQQVLQRAVVVETAVAQVDGEHLAGVEAALLDDVGLVDPPHADLRPRATPAVAGDREAHRPQPVGGTRAPHPSATNTSYRTPAVTRPPHPVDPTK